MNSILYIFTFLIGFGLAFILMKYLIFPSKLKEMKKQWQKRSISSRKGNFIEQIAPYLPNFKYNPADLRYVGKPVDYIVFDGLDENNLRKIVFLEVKSGRSSLNLREEKARKVVEKGLVEWDTYRIKL